MKRKFTLITAALALLACLAIPIGSWGQTYSPVTELTSLSEGTYCIAALYNNDNKYYTVPNTSINGQTFSCTEATFENNVLTPANGHGEFVLTAVSGVNNAFYLYNTNLGKYLVATGSKKFGYVDNTSSDYGYWTFSEVSSGGFSGVFSVQHSNKTHYMRAYNNSVRCYDGASNNGVYLFVQNASSAPSISASNVDIAYNATGGSIEYNINSGVTGGAVTSAVVTASNPSNWLTVNGSNPYSSPIGLTCEANSTGFLKTATVTLTYTYNTSETVTKDVTVTQAANPTVVFNTMQDIFDKATEVGSTATSVNIALQNWVVSGVSTGSGKSVFVTDGTKGFVIFDNDGNLGFAVGNILSGTVTCNVQLYNGFAEITALNSSTSGLSIATGGTVTVADIAMASLAGINTGALVSYENLTCSVTSGKYYLSDGTTTLQVYNTLYAFDALENGESYNITGVYQQYNNTKEILPRSATDIVKIVGADPIINAENVNIAYGATGGSISYTINNEPNPAGTLTAAVKTGTTPTIANFNVGTPTASAVPFTCDANSAAAAHTATMTLTYTYGNSQTVTKDVTITQAAAPTIASLPFTFNSGKANIEDTDGLTQNGLGSDYSDSNAKLKFDNTGDWLLLYFNERPGTLTFKIKNNSFSGGTFKVQTSEDGVVFTDLQTYTSITGTQTEEFTTLGENVRYIKWIYTERSSGNVGLGSIALAKYVAPVPTITVDPTSVNVTAAGGDGTLTVAYTEIDDTNDPELYWYTDNTGATQTTKPDWITSATINATTLNVDYTISANTGAARTAYFKVYGISTNGDDVYSDLITISQDSPFVSFTCTKATSIVSGKHYIITNGGTYAMGYQKSNNRDAVEIELTGNVATVGSEAVYEFVIIGPDVDGFYTIYDVANSKYLYAASSGSNHLKIQDNINDNARWNITFDATDGFASIVATNSNNRNVMQFNSNLFSCYAAASYDNVYLYAKDNESTVSYNTTINAYTNNSNGWYLIAPPVGQVTPTTGNYILAPDYDLYYFDQSETKEWRNYKQGAFNLVSGHGYLYANSNPVTLTFEGMPYVGNGQVFLAYDGGAELPGYNLIGNPYNTSATVNKEFYRMNETHDGIIVDPVAANGPVAAMEGIFVVATEAGQSVTFTPASQNAPAPSNQLVMNLSYNTRGSAIDRAIVRFGEGNQLPKLQLFENSTKVYIPQGGKDYAIANSNGQGEMPLNFVAAKNGQYTLTVNAENVEMNYLHLIDNLTGADIDLLQTPSYTFNGKTTDYASRFRLVFSANNVNDNQEGNTNFAYINGEEIVILNAEANATLQVVDLTGRIVSSTNVAHSVSTSGMVPGVYVLRLINGTDVKVQKIVVD